MKNSIITLNKEKLIYRGISYDYSDFLKKVRLLKNRIIIILNESIYIKKVDIGEGNNDLKEYIDTYIEEGFIKGEDYLMDYKIDESHSKLYVYAIKSGKMVTSLCRGAKNITVLPIQTIIMNKINKKYNTKNYTCFFSYYNVLYCIKIKDKLMEASSNISTIEEIKRKIINTNSKDTIYVTKDLEGLFNKFNVTVIPLEDWNLISEKVFN
ncbi:MAG: hypothetical protein E7214_15590 [Clostridium sp.]|nr:hypothetical protein [Clostridium sp.]